MSHPKIPPNSLHFRTNALGFVEFVLHWDHNRHNKFLVALISGPLVASMQRMIADTARCAWLDEEEKWATLPVNDCKNFDDIAAWKQEAHVIAEQWKKWGRGEPWE